MNFSIPPAAMTGTSDAGTRDSARIENAARQFEALLLTVMLRAARSESAGWLGSGEDASASSAMEMGEEFLAQSLAAQGGLGLARLVKEGLDRQVEMKLK